MPKSKRKAYIMRGISGSGKSTRARELAGACGAVHSTDDFFVNHGRHEFDPELLAQYHHYNFIAFCASLDRDISPVICDNTNVCRRDYQHYIEAACEAGYDVEIVVMPHLDPEVAAARTTHGVPVEKIRNALARWED